MRDTLPLLDAIPFPALRRGRLDTLQINVGYRCNQSCFHCHVNAGPNRTEEMAGDVADTRARVSCAAAHRDARHHRRRARAQRAFPPAGDRGAQARRQGDGPLQSDHPGAAGPGGSGGVPRGQPRRGGRLDAVLSAGQCRAPARQGRVRRLDPRAASGSTRSATGATRRCRSTSSTIRKGRRCRRRKARSKPTTSACSASATASCSTNCYVLANMPIQRFGSMLLSKGEFDDYLRLLQDAHLDANLDGVMCRNLISVDWQGFVYDCDFNQMLDLPLDARPARARASCRSARRGHRRQSGPRRRPLLRLHRRPRLELRRRAERGGGMNAFAHHWDEAATARAHLPARLCAMRRLVFDARARI